MDRYLRWASAPAFLARCLDGPSTRTFLQGDMPSQALLLQVPELQELLQQWRDEKATNASMLTRTQSLLGFQGTRSALASGWLGIKPTWANDFADWGESQGLPFGDELWKAGWHYDLLNALSKKKLPDDLPTWIAKAKTTGLELHAKAGKLAKLQHDHHLMALWLLRPVVDFFEAIEKSETPPELSAHARATLWIDGVGLFRESSWALYYLRDPLQLRPKDRDLYRMAALMRLHECPDDPYAELLSEDRP